MFVTLYNNKVALAISNAGDSRVPLGGPNLSSGELGGATLSTRSETHAAKHIDTPNILLEFSMVL